MNFGLEGLILGAFAGYFALKLVAMLVLTAIIYGFIHGTWWAKPFGGAVALVVIGILLWPLIEFLFYGPFRP